MAASHMMERSDEVKDEFKKTMTMILTFFCIAALSILFFFVIFRADVLKRLIYKVIGILRPFVYGFVIAYLLKPVCNTYEAWIERFAKPKKKRTAETISLVLGMFTGIIVVYAVLSMLLPQLAVSVSHMVKILPSIVDEVSTMVDGVFDGNVVIQSYVNQISDAGTESLSGWIKESLLPYMNIILNGLSDSMMNVAGIFFDLFVGIVVAIYILAGRKKFKRQVKLMLYSIFKTHYAEKIIEELHFTDRMFTGFISGKMLDSAIIGIICYVFMLITKLPYAMLISVIVGVTNFIPFFGPYIGAIPSAVILLTVSPTSCLVFIVFIVILQQIDGNIIGPRILGSSTGLSGIWVLFAILIFGGLFGFPGMIVGVPVFAVIYDLIKKLIFKGLKYRGQAQMIEAYEEEYPRKS